MDMQGPDSTNRALCGEFDHLTLLVNAGEEVVRQLRGSCDLTLYL